MFMHRFAAEFIHVSNKFTQLSDLISGQWIMDSASKTP